MSAFYKAKIPIKWHLKIAIPLVSGLDRTPVASASRIFRAYRLRCSLVGFTRLERKIYTNWFFGSAHTKVPVKHYVRSFPH